jgi:hypothetical protein
MFGGWTMPVHFFRREPGAAELRRLARRESGRVLAGSDDREHAGGDGA